MKRFLLIFMVFAMLLSTIVGASAQAPLMNFDQWAYSEDFTSIVIDGKEYENIVITISGRGSDLLVEDLSRNYVLNPNVNDDYSQEEFYSRRIHSELAAKVDGIISNYPTIELVYINHEPWQESPYANEVMDIFESYLYRRHAERDPERLERELSWLEDPSMNGNAFNEREGNPIVPLDQRKTVIDKRLLKGTSDHLSELGAWDTRNGIYDIDGFATTSVASYDQARTDIDLEIDEPNLPEPDPDYELQLRLQLDRKEMHVIRNRELSRLEMDIPPEIRNDRTLVPIRVVMEQLGADVQWDGEARTIDIIGYQEIQMTIDQRTASLNGQTILMDASPIIEQDRTLVPLRFISENLGYEVEWVEEDRRIIITK